MFNNVIKAHTPQTLPSAFYLLARVPLSILFYSPSLVLCLRLCRCTGCVGVRGTPFASMISCNYDMNLVSLFIFQRSFTPESVSPFAFLYPPWKFRRLKSCSDGRFRWGNFENFRETERIVSYRIVKRGWFCLADRCVFTNVCEHVEWSFFYCAFDALLRLVDDLCERRCPHYVRSRSLEIKSRIVDSLLAWLTRASRTVM